MPSCQLASRLRPLNFSLASRIAILLSVIFSHQLPAAETAAATADESRQFKVEVIIFKHLYPDTEEQFQTPPRTPDISDLYSLVEFTPFSAQQKQLLPAEAFHLAEQEDKFRRSRGYSVLSHLAWTISIEENQIKHYRIPTVLDEENRQELDGVIAVGLRRYLHVNPDIRLTDWAEPERSFLDDLFNDLNQPMNPGLPEPESFGEEMATDAIPAPIFQATTQHPFSTQGLVKSRFYQINQNRRVRSGELHFFDHPVLGMLVQITPVSATGSEAQTVIPQISEGEIVEEDLDDTVESGD